MTALAAHPGSLSPPASRQELLALTYHRLMMAMLLFAGVTLLIVARLGLLQIVSDRSGGQAIGDPLVPARADIVDRNGIPLARTIDAWTIGIHPKRLLGDVDYVAA